MSVMEQIELPGLQWYAARMKPPQNPGRRTCVTEAQYTAVRDRHGKVRKRRVKGTGQREFVHEVLLKKAGFEVFMPKRVEWRRVNPFSVERRRVTYPLLHNWVFVGWPMFQERWSDLAELNIVNGLLGDSGQPLPVPHAKVVEMMRVWEAPACLAAMERRWMRTGAEFEVGDIVQTPVGTWSGFDMEVVEVTGPSAKLLVNIFGRPTPLELPTDLLEPVRA